MEHFDYSKLSIEERMALAVELWDSIPSAAEAGKLTQAQKVEIDRRWAAYQAGEMPSYTWEEVEQRILQNLKK